MFYDPHDTIAAIATAPGSSCRGMIRASGPATLSVVRKSFRAKNSQSFDSLHHAKAIAGELAVSLTGAAATRFPCDLFIWPNERSYTREVVAEFHTIGSPPLLQAALDSICRAGARLAEPGEFTLRAFLAGRLDLTQAEAVLGVIDAEHDGELRTALSQLAGGLARPLHDLRDELLGLLAELEAGLDFVEDDIQFISAGELVRRLQIAATTIRNVATQMASRYSSNELPQVALVGRPNAGKSSLFNALATKFGIGSESALMPALVSNECGTTRDYLIAQIDAAGVRVEIVDTAGLDLSTPTMHQGTATASARVNDAAKSAAVERSRRALVRALCVDSTLADARGLLAQESVPQSSFPPADVVILTKCDVATQSTRVSAPSASGKPVIVTSSVTERGLDELCRMLSQLLNRDGTQSAGCVVATADRCRDSLRLADAAVSQAAEIAATNGGDELVAAELRAALAELGKVVGTVYTDDLLDRIFKTFCIGK
jgi:tRNA modification GTPase